MPVRLAITNDLEPLEKMLLGMGQKVEPDALKQRLVDPWITIVHVDEKGNLDGFYEALSLYEKEGYAILGPGDYLPARQILDPQKRADAWLRAIYEMGLAIEDEEVRRRPKIDPKTVKICTRIWPIMGPTQQVIESQMAWRPRPDASKDGYDLIADAAVPSKQWGKAYWQTRADLVAKARANLDALNAQESQVIK